MFGIVKTAHKSKLGEVQQMSYQMVNSLDESIMPDVIKESVEYITKLKTDNEAFLDYLQKHANFSNDFQVLVDLCRQNMDFTRSTYFRARKKKIIEAYVLNFKNGKVIQNADNLVIVGSPYAMLIYAATGREESVDNDDTFSVENGAIQCYTERFDDDDHLAGFRSPYNSRNNMNHLHNVRGGKLEQYFSFGKQIIAVNMIGTDFQSRNNGSDQDSDSLYVTNQFAIVDWAKYCYTNYPTIENNIPKEKNVYDSSMNSYATMDNNLAKSQTDIGESSNLAQIALTYASNFDDSKYIDYVCILSVIAQCAIDNAKRRFDVDITKEIQRIKKDMDIKTHKYPSFWAIIKKGFNKKNINRELHCPMNFLHDIKLQEFHSPAPTLPMSYFFNKYELDQDRRKCKKVEDLIGKYSLQLFLYNVSEANYMERNNEYLLLRSDFEELVNDIKSVYISKTYLGLVSWLLDRAFLISPHIRSNSFQVKTSIDKNRSLLLKVLYDVNKDAVLKCFSRNCP